MLEKAVKKKAAHFDLSAATAWLSAALGATDLVDDPDMPATDTAAMAAVAMVCGATDEEAAGLFVPTVPAMVQ
jgi:hypothetical protein